MRAVAQSRVFDIRKGISVKKLLAEMSKTVTVQLSPARTLPVRFYDTFDWRVYNEGFMLLREGNQFILTSRRDASNVVSMEQAGEAGFWWDFAQGPFQDRMKKILEERAVLSFGDVKLRVRTMCVLNADEKTVVRARIEEGKISDQTSGLIQLRRVNVQPVKGYWKEAGKFVKLLGSIGLKPATKSTLQTVAEAGGRIPGDYTSKLAIQLDPSMTAQQAAGVIFSYLLDIIERNVPGIQQDIDTEFLHDFRVAIRRTRSGLSQIKGILPKTVIGEFGGAFADIGRASNRLRDLDVYLLSRDRYSSMLSEDLGQALDPLFDRLASERHKEHAAVARLIDSKRFKNLVREWRQTLAAFGTTDLTAKRFRTPVKKVADRVISRRFKRVVEAGGRIDDQSPAADLHALRISCKNLRYLLEFFTTLYPAQDIGGLVKQLKKFQDNLGEFNDLSVQQDELKASLGKDSANQTAATSAAVGALIAKLESRQSGVRRKFSSVFKGFVAPKNVKIFEKLFRSA